VAAATMMFLASCGKNSDTSLQNIPLTDKCTACDKLKQDIMTNSNFSDLQIYLDSMYCSKDYNGEICKFNIKDTYQIGKYETYPPLFKLGLWYNIIKNSEYGKYQKVYACDRATVDTPFVFPMFLMVDFEESRPAQRGITAYIKEFDQYLDSITYYDSKTGKDVRIMGYKSNKSGYSTTGFVQFGDTVKWELRGKKVTENGITTTYPYMRYNFVMSPDMETMHLIVTVKKDYPISTSPVYRTFSSCVLKRVK
jgi:hypothetical protein